ncbi:MAG: carboxymuconolactone decarboxylase family protein [Proteobacteria bacterium]|nr:carboxymuconolactone decarboxylase family protein [Pseudomonadota bacterium]
MARIDLVPGDSEETERLFRWAPHVSGPASALSWAVYDKSRLPVRLRELMRMRIAQINQCHV